MSIGETLLADGRLQPPRASCARRGAMDGQERRADLSAMAGEIKRVGASASSDATFQPITSPPRTNPPGIDTYTVIPFPCSRG